MSASPYYTDEHVTLYHGDCREVMPQIEGVTAIVSDPPYGLSFMGKGWDHGVPGEDFWRIASGCCLPGAPMLAFGGTRTYHRLVCAIEDAGWEVRDCLQWLYGSGFPKSHNIGKGLDKAAGAERKRIPLVGGALNSGTANGWNNGHNHSSSAPLAGTTQVNTPAARTWDGWGTALKPAHEPICLAMNPLDGTFAHNALEHGVAGLNVDGGRVGIGDDRTSGGMGSESTTFLAPADKQKYARPTGGRWPANIIHDGSEEVLAGFPVTGGAHGGNGQFKQHTWAGNGKETEQSIERDNGGSAARFFYCAKASKAERNRGCEYMPEQECGMMEDDNYPMKTGSGNLRKTVRRNTHPTVKPLALMRYLCTLVTMPERNLILDPFAGSGTTGVACKELGLPCVLIEQDEHHCEIIAARIAAAKQDAPPPPSPQKEFAL